MPDGQPLKPARECREWIFTLPLGTGPRLKWRYVRCYGHSEDARNEMKRMFGDFAMQYQASEAAGLEADYGYEELVLPEKHWSTGTGGQR